MLWLCTSYLRNQYSPSYSLLSLSILTTGIVYLAMKIYALCKQINVRTFQTYPHIFIKKGVRNFALGLPTQNKSCVENGNIIDINDEELASRLQEIKHVFDLRDPGQL